MSNKRNYQKEMEKIIGGFQGERKRLFLHSCCAPCSSAVLEQLQEIFQVTVFYYNPNITEYAEYRKRVEEQIRLIQYFNEKKPDFPIEIIDGDYEPQKFMEMAKGLENCPEGGERCFGCYRLRLEKTAVEAAKRKYDYFTSSLTISPMKNAEKLNQLGEELAAQTGCAFLPSDFKKKEGYKRSVQLSEELSLYRQNYCGCGFSKAESIKREREKAEQRES